MNRKRGRNVIAPAEDKNWVEQQLLSGVPLTPSNMEKMLITEFLNQCYELQSDMQIDIGILLAASFDLLVAAEYYGKATNKGWLYCQNGSPLLLYPYSNVCTRCILDGKFLFHQANKLASGQIGETTSRLLCLFLEAIFERQEKNIKVFKGKEPVDVFFFDATSKVLFFTEVKASPLTTLSLAVKTELQTDNNDDGSAVAVGHGPYSNPSIGSSDLQLFLPVREADDWSYELVPLGIRGETYDAKWGYELMYSMLTQSDQFFKTYIRFWQEAFLAYQNRIASEKIYWFTNGCGQPTPKPSDWPKRGTGYESISASKTSVGLDRTDDIKKGFIKC
jgi:hypothetical protein